MCSIKKGCVLLKKDVKNGVIRVRDNTVIDMPQMHTEARGVALDLTLYLWYLTREPETEREYREHRQSAPTELTLP